MTREARRAERERQERSAAEQAWIDAHTDELSHLAAALAREADRFIIADDDREWVDEIARDGSWTPGSLAALGVLAAPEVQTAEQVVALDGTRPHAVHQVLEQIAGLRSMFAAMR